MQQIDQFVFNDLSIEYYLLLIQVYDIARQREIGGFPPFHVSQVWDIHQKPTHDEIYVFKYGNQPLCS